ncbi:MAG: winged helix-turn-helix domain-containing protein [Aliidongia sp.]
MTTREYAFGRYRLQPGRELSADGLPLAVGGKALEVLASLVEAAGDLVTKSELMDRVWPDIVVEEHNIQVHISALRKVLGTDAGWIVTVPKARVPVRRARHSRGAEETDAQPPALPRPLNPLYGRENDLASVRAILDQARPVTLVGPGGISIALLVDRLQAGDLRFRLADASAPASR